MDILGTAAYGGYIQTPIQTLDDIYINQLKQFLPLAEEPKCLAEEIHKEKLDKQWAGIPHKKLLNQSFLDQLNLLQILEQLAPLQLAKEHLPSDIIDILERLRKADNISFNQLYYIAENCADRYHSKVIQTFVSMQTAIFSRGSVFLCTNLCKVLWSKLCLDPMLKVMHCATFGERCETVREFFVRVLRSSRVDLIM